MRTKIRSGALHRWVTLSISEVSQRVSATVRGWVNYYGLFNPSLLSQALRSLDFAIVKRVRWNYKNLKCHKTGAWGWFTGLMLREPTLFPHWRMGAKVGR